MKSLVAIMAVGRENKHHNRIFVDTVHKTVLLGDASTPTPFRLPFQGLRMSRTCRGMLHQLDKKFCQFLEGIWFAMLKQPHMLLGFIGITELVHSSQRLLRNVLSSSTEFICLVFPCRYSSSPRSSMAKKSSSDIKVGSFSCSLTTRRTYFATRANAISLPEIAPRPCRISALYELIVAVFILIVFIV